MNGPPFLSKPKSEWSSEADEEFEKQTEDPEKRKLPSSIAVVTKPQPLLDPEHFSSWEKLVRITAYCQCFVNNLKQAKQDPANIKKGELKPEECEDAERYWIREAQCKLKI